MSKYEFNVSYCTMLAFRINSYALIIVICNILAKKIAYNFAFK